MTFPMTATRTQPALTESQLRTMAPSIYAAEPWDQMSDKYTFIPTSGVVKAMQDNGFVPVRARQARTRIAGKQDFTRHMVVFRAPEHTSVRRGDIFPEVTLVNSHDGTSAYKLYAGLFRLVCLNGLMVSEGQIASQRATHGRKTITDQVLTNSFQMTDEIPQVIEQIDAWRTMQLPSAARSAFANAALTMRYGTRHHPVAGQDLLRARRNDDRSLDLWTTFNVVQEHVIAGGLRGKTADYRRIRTRAVTGIPTTIAYNRGLWAMTMTLAEMHRDGRFNDNIIDIVPIQRSLERAVGVIEDEEIEA